MKQTAAQVLAVLALTGCGGGTSNTTDSENNQSGTTVLKGQFLDNAVKGLSYVTETQSGITNEFGEFNYIAGETVSFSIGALAFPPVLAAHEVTPASMTTNNSASDNVAVNIAWLLQSLDEDADLSNGISISNEAELLASAVNFNESSENFSANTSVINLVANSGSTNTSLIALTDATSHLEETVSSLSYERMDTLAEFQTIFDRKLSQDTNSNNYFNVRENGTFDGEWADVPFTGTWQLDADGYYCRTAIEGANYILQDFKVDCQMWRYKDATTIRGTRNKGASDIWWNMIVESSVTNSTNGAGSTDGTGTTGGGGATNGGTTAGGGTTTDNGNADVGGTTAGGTDGNNGSETSVIGSIVGLWDGSETDPESGYNSIYYRFLNDGRIVYVDYQQDEFDDGDDCYDVWANGYTLTSIGGDQYRSDPPTNSGEPSQTITMSRTNNVLNGSYKDDFDEDDDGDTNEIITFSWPLVDETGRVFNECPQ